jgi:hypothetical protein
MPVPRVESGSSTACSFHSFHAVRKKRLGYGRWYRLMLPSECWIPTCSSSVEKVRRVALP